MAAMIGAAVLGILIIALMPTEGCSMGYSLMMILMVAALAFIGNTVSLVSLGLNKERFDGSGRKQA